MLVGVYALKNRQEIQVGHRSFGDAYLLVIGEVAEVLFNLCTSCVFRRPRNEFCVIRGFSCQYLENGSSVRHAARDERSRLKKAAYVGSRDHAILHTSAQQFTLSSDAPR